MAGHDREAVGEALLQSSQPFAVYAQGLENSEAAFMLAAVDKDTSKVICTA
jgi:hypothetical protein